MFLYICLAQFTSKQLERLSKKAEKDSEKEQAKVKKVKCESMLILSLIATLTICA